MSAQLDVALTAQLKGYLDNLKTDVELVPHLDGSEKSNELSDLVNEIAALHPLVEVVEGQASKEMRVPSFRVQRKNDPTVFVDFAGIPLGHEFNSVVLALLHVGGHPPKLSAEIVEQIKGLTGPLHFETFFSLTCQNCPEVVQALNMMSVLNPQITHVAIDGALFQDEIESRKIMAVPTVFLNGAEFSQGRMGVEQFVAKLDTGAQANAVAKINDAPPYDVLIVGGGPGGASAGVYAARKGVRTGIVTDRFGGQVLDTAGIENLISVKHTEGPLLARALEEHVKEYDVDIMNLQKGSKLTVPAEPNGLFRVDLESGASLESKTIILSTGARWRQMGVPGEETYRNRGVAYCPHCDGPLFKGKRVAVVGGGNSGVEAAIDLAGITAHVTLIEFDTVLRADEVLQRRLASLPNVTVMLNSLTTEVIGDDQKVTALVVKDRSSNALQTIELQGIFVQIGLLPNTEWLKGTVELTERGEIMVDSRGETSVPGVFAAGDCTNSAYKQIVIALGSGATAGLSAFDYLMRAPVVIK